MSRLFRYLASTLMAAVVGAAAPALAGSHDTERGTGERPEVVVYKSPECGCCTGWADHVAANGYAVTTRDLPDLETVKKTAGVPAELQSCHTAVVGGYVIEGHVPASAIDRLLAERPSVRGLAVPGMPIGSPGMEGPDPEPYDVMSFDKSGKTSVFMSVPAGN